MSNALEREGRAHDAQLPPAPERLLEQLRHAMREFSESVANLAAVLRDRYDKAA
jgi:hypothetical protein